MRNTHDRQNDHHSVDLATNVVLAAATSTYSAGATVEAIIDSLDDRVAAASSAAAQADPSPFEFNDPKWRMITGVEEVWGNAETAYLTFQDDYAELGASTSAAYVAIGANINLDSPGRIALVSTLGLKVPVIASDPGWAEDGTIYYNSTSKKLRIYANSAWAPLLAENASVSFVMDGGGSAITTGIKGDVEIPFAGTIKAARLFADQTGSIVVDIWKDTYANFPPTDADSITASAPPTITSASKSEDTTLTSWTTSIAAGDVLRFNVDSCSTITRATLALTIERT